ncbi:MAG: stage sporulation protein [Acidobacteriota bacterium]|jgi:stage V sporulation protein R|nr:stage sporulation protein [Acidobacteriota bacterium]
MHDREIKDLEKALEQIWDVAQKFGLEPFPTRFEIVPAAVMYEIGSYALPGRYSHWTFGKAYNRMKTMYDFGLSKIYEVVINTNPSYGFLLETNSPIQNKMVMAHVLGHVDFFKNNIYFSKTNRRMVESVSTHSGRMTEYEFKYGRKSVEKLLDAILAIEEHIDPNFFIKRERPEVEEMRRTQPKPEGRYDDLWKLGEKKEEEITPDEKPRGDLLPEKDIVYYIMRNSPQLQPWQSDVMAMMHEEMEYFIPQMQTKTMNEGWACATGDSLLVTENGFVRFDELYESRQKIMIASGGAYQLNCISDFHKEEQVSTIRIRTRRGLTIEGADKHRIQLGGGRWVYLKDISIGDKISLACGTKVWAGQKQALDFAPTKTSATLETVAALAGVSYWTALRHLRGRNTQQGEAIEVAIATTAYQPGNTGRVIPTRNSLNAPKELNEEVAWFLGYFVGDGNRTKSGICLTTGDDEIAQSLSHVIASSFGLSPKLKWDATEVGGRWRVVVHSRELLRWIESVGINLEDKARSKKIPAPILRSPKSVMTAFLRGYFDADAYAGPEGVRLSSSSQELIHTVQTVLLNYGILSRQRRHLYDILQLEISGASAALFLDEIGFSLARKQRALRDCIEGHRWFKKEELTDTIISIEYGCADVYDITVNEKHAYVANGFINHNSFWHSRIMRELELTDSEHMEFAELHSGVVSPHKGQLNPYYLGYKIFEDIERRWENPTPQESEKFGIRPGSGREKIFEVRELDNDVSFLRNYLTEELCEELDLFVYELVEEEEWTITEKRWERVRDQLVANMTNFGFPYIEVADGDYNNNRELYLRHAYEGAELDGRYARKALEHVFTLWGRPVHLETVADDEPVVMHYDGQEHDED